MHVLQIHLSRLASAWRRFRRQRRGNVAITFALALIPLLAFVGIAIDYSRANVVKAQLQAALDSTALMVAHNAATVPEDELQAAAQKFFLAMFNDPKAKNVIFSADYSTTGGLQIVVKGSADVDTAIIGMFGFPTITVGGSATAKWGANRLRVALVLDNTGSMNDSGKLTALKTATKNLLMQLRSAASTNGDVYVSIIPFSKDVNLGAGNYNSSWENWIDWSLTAPANSMPPSNVGPGSPCPYSGGCVTQPGGTTPTWTIPSSGYICPRYSIGCYDSVQKCTGWYCSYTHKWFVNPAKWSGCVTDRGTSLPPGTSAGPDQDARIAPTSSNPFPAEQYSDCPQAMMGLNYNWVAMNLLVDNMVAEGSTNQPIGLVWGWQSLIGGGPFTMPAMDPNYKYNQVIILLSDGLNTQDRWYGNGYDHNTSVDYRMLDNYGRGTCANFKNSGSANVANIIYTVQVNTDRAPTSTLLRNCASPDNVDPKGQKFFLLTSANQIIDIFNQIGTELTKLRIAQ
jgi:Flp pilus assembly protein TadG